MYVKIIYLNKSEEKTVLRSYLLQKNNNNWP